MSTPARYRLRLAIVVSALFFTGCLPSPSTDPNASGTGPAKLKPFGSAGDLLDYFKQQAQGSASRGGIFPLGAPAAAEDATNTAGDGSTQTGDGDDAFSSTNLQEAGVDESDRFKSDGVRFYIASGTELLIVRAAPVEELAVLGRLDLGDTIESLYLYDGRVIVLAYRDEDVGGGPGAAELLIWPPYYWSRSTVVSAIDISDPGNPSIAAQVELDGSIAHSRLVNGRLILVLSIAPDIIALAEGRSTNDLRNVTLEDVLPQATIDGESRALAGWQQWLHPDVPDGYYMNVVATLDAADITNILASTGVLAGAGTIYASPQAIYLTDQDYTTQGTARTLTSIHKLAFDDNGVPHYVGSGAVTGRLLNQFSLGEHDGKLRVATHIDAQFFGGDDVAVADAPVQSAQDIDFGVASNAVFVLSDTGTGLEVTGSITNIAPNERIYAARFLGRRGFLVTFRQIDPLFVLDLSDASNPAIVGELKIPGYSDYLHPVGESLLIGVGRSTRTTSFGGVVPDQLQLSLFDVSDLANPTVIQQLTLGGAGSSSEVSSTHKAFVYLAEESDDAGADGTGAATSGLLAIPARLLPQNSGFEYVEPEFDGVVCYRVTSLGFEPLGQLAAVTDANDSFLYYGYGFRRPALIGDVLYAISERGVRGSELPGLDPRFEVIWTAP